MLARLTKLYKNNIFLPISFSILGTLVCLWQLLIPGYIMTLDTVIGPIATFPNFSALITSGDMFYSIYWMLGDLFGTMLIQKIYIAAIFFCLFYFPLVYFPFKVADKYKYLGSLFFAINPFVYERFLAGQWAVLAGYTFTFPFIYFLIKFVREINFKNLQKLLIVSFVVGVFSFHFLVIVSILTFIMFIYIGILYLCKYVKLEINLQNTLRLISMFVIYLALHSYWIVPSIYNQQNVVGFISDFDSTHTEAFKTNLTEQYGVFGVFSLYGFWGEREEWARQFGIVAYDKFIVFIPILFIVFYGLYALIRKREDRRVGLLVFMLIICSAVFSIGVGDGYVRYINQYLFDNVFFWSGFRDSHKWSGVLGALMSILLVVGASHLTDRLKGQKYINIILIIFAIPIIIYTSQILFGFNNKLQVAQYPEEWREVNEIIKQEENCKAIFLPWNSYYYLSFNKGLLTANSAKNYFNCEMYISNDPEFHSINMSYANSPEYNQIVNILNSEKNVEAKVAQIRELGVKFVIVTKDMLREKRFSELFTSEYLNLIYDTGTIALFRIE